MNELDWQEALVRKSEDDPWAGACRAQVKALTPAYLAILESLPPWQQEALSDYIAACEEYEHAMTLLAYALGREHASTC